MAQSRPGVAPAGFRVEALLGGDHSSVYGQHGNGFLYGLGAGYDLAVGSSVSFGIDAEATGATTSDSGAKAGRDLYAGARASFAVAPGANLYVKGGYTNARMVWGGSSGDNFEGYRVGAGGQIAIGGKVYTGLEYRYSHYQASTSRHQLALTLGTRF